MRGPAGTPCPRQPFPWSGRESTAPRSSSANPAAAFPCLLSIHLPLPAPTDYRDSRRRRNRPSPVWTSSYTEQQREQHSPGQPAVRLSLMDDVFLRSSTGAWWQRGVPLPADR